MIAALGTTRVLLGLSAVALTVGLLLSVTRPTPTQFKEQIWYQALAGVKADLANRRAQSPVYQLLKTTKAVPVLGYLEHLKDGELDRLPDVWMGKTRADDYFVFSWFTYQEPACSSAYLGVGGYLFNFNDGCGVEAYRGGKS